MNFRNQLGRKIGALLFLGGTLVLIFPADLCAAEKPFSAALKRKKALVSIQSVSASDAAGNAFAQLVAQRKARPVNYMRDGSGVIIDSQGMIVTNAHIVQNATSISVTFFNGTKVPGKLVFVVPDSDIAFISVIPPFALNYVPLADSDRVSVGMPVFAIGRALNHCGAVFGGKISGIAFGLNRGVSRPVFLQAVFGFHFYSGDSGSPILNQKGDLLGLLSGGRRNGDKAAVAVPSNLIRDAYWSIVPR